MRAAPGTLTGIGERRFARLRTLLRALVAERSTPGAAGVERCLDLVADWIGPYATELRRVPCGAARNLVAVVGHGPPSRRVTFSGHVDVVPAGGAWDCDPFTLGERDGFLVGRGVCDMKGAVAAVCEALAALGDAGMLDACSFELAITGDEESGSEHGTVPLLAGGHLSGRMAVCGEATGLGVWLGNRGLLWLEVDVLGRGGHTGMPARIENPLPVAASLASALAGLSLTGADERFDPATPSLTLSSISGGDDVAPNVAPDAVRLVLDRRLLPGESAEDAREQVEAVVADQVCAPFRSAVRVLRTCPAYVIDAGTPVVRLASRAVRDAGLSVALGTDAATNDSSWFLAAGIPAVLLGPGEPAQAHATGERVSCAELAAALEVYARLVIATAEAGIGGDG